MVIQSLWDCIVATFWGISNLHNQTQNINIIENHGNMKHLEYKQVWMRKTSKLTTSLLRPPMEDPSRTWNASLLCSWWVWIPFVGGKVCCTALLLRSTSGLGSMWFYRSHLLHGTLTCATWSLPVGKPGLWRIWVMVAISPPTSSPLSCIHIHPPQPTGLSGLFNLQGLFS